MSDIELWEAPIIVPSLAYKDVSKAVKWLERVFGFKERSEARLSWPGGSRAWLEVDNGLISISTSGGREIYSPQSTGSATQSLKVYVNNIDQHFTQAKAEGAEIISEIDEGFWGGRYYRALDLEKHLLVFSQHGKELAVKHWKLPPGLKRG